VVSSHAGLTCGGIVAGASMRVELMLDVFDAMTACLQREGVDRLVYKPVPHIYHRYPAEEDLYALFRQRAVLQRRDVSVTIAEHERLPISKGRQWALKQARKGGLAV